MITHTTPHHTLRIQQSFRQFANIDHWTSPYAVTLTMKQAIQATDGYRDVTTFLDSDKASQNLRHFLNLLNRRVFGKAHSRGKRLRVIPVLEGGNGKRLHYHLMIDCPRDDLKAEFPGIVHDTWQATDWAFRQTYIQSHADDGWMTYISKFRDKPDYANAIDWLNYHNPDCRV